MPQSGRNCCDSSMDNAVCGGGKAHGVCCPGRDTAARRKKAFLASFLCLTKRMEKFRRGFYWFVRSCGCGVLIRGLQNLDAPCKGDVFTFFLRRAKRTKKHARGLRTSGLRGRFKALPEVILQKFPRHVSKSVLPAKRRRKGFESVRKGYRTADARLMFFEKEKVYCKLTEGCRG